MQQTQRTSDEFEMDSRRELIANNNNNSLGTESDNSAQQQHHNEISRLTDNNNTNNKSSSHSNDTTANKQRVTSSNASVKKTYRKQSTKLVDRNGNEIDEQDGKKSNYTGVFDASILMYEEDMGEGDSMLGGGGHADKKAATATKTAAKNGNPAGVNLNKLALLQSHNLDDTTRGGLSTTYNQQLADDSLSTLSDKKKKVIVRIVTVFSVIFFLICFAMIAFTLRMSEKIDAQIRKGYSGSNFNALATTKTSNLFLNGSNSSVPGSNLKATISSQFKKPTPRSRRLRRRSQLSNVVDTALPDSS